MSPTPATCQVRKIHRAGRSVAIIIPPAALDHIKAKLGDYLYFSIEAPGFLILNVAPIPPNYTNAELFAPVPPPPPATEEPPPHQTTDNNDDEEYLGEG